jgi:hypothetical protein
MPATLCNRDRATGPPSGNLCTTGGKRRLWSRSDRWKLVERVGAPGQEIQAEAAFDGVEPLDEELEELEELDEEDDEESLEDEDEPPEESEDPEEEDESDEDSDLPGFTVLLVDVLRESVR